MKQAPLQKSLRDLVSGFGYENVRKALRGMQPEKAAALNRHPKTGRATADASSTKPGKKRTKPNALAIVKSFDLTNDEKNKLLFILAEKYEAKEFMPGVNHVRGFLHGTEIDVARIKSRQQVTATVFKELADLDTDKLQEILDRGLYGPTKRLATFAKAIEGFNRPDRSP